MKKLLLCLLCFGSMSGLIIPPGFCQSIEDILKNSSPSDQLTGDRQAEKQSESSSNRQPDAQPDTQKANTTSPLFSLQVGTFKTQVAADRQIIGLQKKGYEPYIFQSVNSRNQTIYAVRIGKFEAYQSAAETLTDVKQKIDTPVLITHYDSLKTVDPERFKKAGPKLAAKSPAPAERDTAPAGQKEPAAEPSPRSTDEAPPGTESLEERINRLESEIDKLKEAEKVRKELQMTEEEAREEEEDVLEAAGEEYYLVGGGNIEFSYGFGYTYNEYNAIKESVRVEEVADHTIRNSVSASYGLTRNITLGGSIPFIYKYHRVGTGDSLEEEDLGDLNLRWRYQPFKPNRDVPSIIFNGSFKIPVGRDPYEITPGEELSTSSGMYSTNLGISVSHTSDPVVVFGSLSGTYRFDVDDIDQKRGEGILDEVDPGPGIGVGLGLAYALSYKLNLNISVNYSYSFETEYKYKNIPEAESGTSASASMRLGAGYRVSRMTDINLHFGIPITDTGSFSFSLSTPIEFEL